METLDKMLSVPERCRSIITKMKISHIKMETLGLCIYFRNTDKISLNIYEDLLDNITSKGVLESTLITIYKVLEHISKNRRSSSVYMDKPTQEEIKVIRKLLTNIKELSSNKKLLSYYTKLIINTRNLDHVIYTDDTFNKNLNFIHYFLVSFDTTTWNSFSRVSKATAYTRVYDKFLDDMKFIYNTFDSRKKIFYILETTNALFNIVVKSVLKNNKGFLKRYGEISNNITDTDYDHIKNTFKKFYDRFMEIVFGYKENVSWETILSYGYGIRFINKHVEHPDNIKLLDNYLNSREFLKVLEKYIRSGRALYNKLAELYIAYLFVEKDQEFLNYIKYLMKNKQQKYIRDIASSYSLHIEYCFKNKNLCKEKLEPLYSHIEDFNKRTIF